MKAGVVLACGLLGSAFADTPAPLMPAEAARTFTTPGDLAWELVLAEPDIAQPVFCNFDERGRLWVVEYRQYPNPAGAHGGEHGRFLPHGL